jgi:signal transduction histidine kinase/DNA-binding response OmpR family regulator
MSYLKTRILVVEDNLQDFIIFKEVLGQIRDFFIQIVHAESMEMAVEKLAEGTFDIIFLDLFLPDSFGKETFQSVRPLTVAPIVILSGLSDKNIALDIVKQGAQDYIVKGEFDANLLDKTIVYSIERKKYQETLEASERRNRTLIQSVGTAIGEYDYTELHNYLEEKRQEGVTDILKEMDLDMGKTALLRGKLKLMTLNPEALKIYGCSSYEDFEANRLTFYTFQVVDYLSLATLALWNREKDFIYELPFQNKQGVLIHTLKKWRFLGNQDGFYRLIISTQDISQIKAKEEEVYLQSQAMESVAVASSLLLQDGPVEERILRSFGMVASAFRASKAAVYLLDILEDDFNFSLDMYWDAEGEVFPGLKNGSIAQWNLLPSVKELQTGRPSLFSKENSPKEIQKLLSFHKLEQVIAAPFVVKGVGNGVVIVGVADSLPLHNYVYSGLMTLAGNIGSAIATSNAQKELKMINEDLELRVDQRTQKMRDAMRELESFSYSVSHDLRAPLRAISGFTEVLNSEYNEKLDDEGKRYLGIIRKGASEMSQLIDDLLHFSRTGRKRLSSEEVEMDKLVNQVVNDLSAQVPDRVLEVEIERLPSCYGDSNMIRQVVVNFVWNAIKFTSKKDSTLIKISAESKGDFIAYTVEDNGVGFNMAYVDKIFGVFQRLHSQEEFEGTGVGLAIVQRIVIRHGGVVIPFGEENKGAKFTFTLPTNPSLIPELEEIIPDNLIR